MPTACSFLYFLFAECDLDPEDISETKEGNYLIRDHDAFISALKNTKVEYSKDSKWTREIRVTAKIDDTEFYIVCNQILDDAENFEIDYFNDSMAGCI